MSEVTHRELLPGVELTAVRTAKFKSAYLSIQLLAPLERERASLYALLPMVLRRGTEQLPDMTAISAALDELYGGAIESIVRKKGETQCVGFVASFLDGAYAPGGADLLERSVELLGELLLHPAKEEGGFVKAYVEGERENLIKQIRSQINDKRRYAVLRLVELMCADESYGIDRLGSEEDAAAITDEALWGAYQELLRKGRIELFYCGSAGADQVAEAFLRALGGMERDEQLLEPDCEVRDNRAQEEPAYYEDVLDVTQGKLARGFRTGGACIWSRDYPALMLLNAIYGGTTMSKLFLNVREKLSLCYYASSQLEKFKGLMLVSSGVASDRWREAKGEILKQLEACRRGEVTPQELESARRGTVSALRTVLDSQGRLEDYWLGQAVAGEKETPEQLCERLERVTAQQVAAVAREVELDTVYLLRNKE